MRQSKFWEDTVWPTQVEEWAASHDPSDQKNSHMSKSESRREMLQTLSEPHTDRVDTCMEMYDFEFDTNIQSIALSDPEIISAGIISAGFPGPLLPRCIQQPFTLWSFATSQDSKTKNWVQIPSYLGFYNLLYVFTSLWFFFRSRGYTFLSWWPKTSSSLKPWRIFGHLQLSPSTPNLTLRVNESLSWSNFFDRVSNIISSVGLSFLETLKPETPVFFHFPTYHSLLRGNINRNIF